MKIGLSHLEIRVFRLVLSHFQCFVEGHQKLLHLKNTKEEIYIINKKNKKGDSSVPPKTTKLGDEQA